MQPTANPDTNTGATYSEKQIVLLHSSYSCFVPHFCKLLLIKDEYFLIYTQQFSFACFIYYQALMFQ